MNLTINVIDNNDVPVAAPGLSFDLDGNVQNNVNPAVYLGVADNSTVTLLVSKAGFISYSNTFTVYEEDLSITIKLAPEINDVDDPDFERPYPFFFVILEPCSYNAHVYNATSSNAGIWSYFFDNEIPAISYGFKNTIINLNDTGLHQIKQRIFVEDKFDRFYATIEVGDINNTLEQNLALDPTTNIQATEFKIEAAISATQDSICIENNCFIIGSEITVTPQFELNLNGCTEATLVYQLINSENIIVEELEYDIIVTPPENALFQFTLVDIGDYKVKATFTTCCGTCVKELVINACNFIKLNQTACNTYDLVNCSNSITINYNVTNIENTETIVPPTDLDPGETDTITFLEDNVYKITYTYDDNGDLVTEILIVVVYCHIEQCLGEYIVNVLCKKDVPCENTDNLQFMLNKVIVLSSTLFMKINALYSLNVVFTSLDESKLLELTEIDDLIDRLTKTCKLIGCYSGCSGPKVKVVKGGCGCH